MDLEHAAPNYLKVSAQLRAEIQQGQYSHKLPTEPQLCERFSVSRNTLRKALELLKDQGFLESKQGSGTFVRQRPQRSVIRRELKVYRDERGYYFDATAQGWEALRTPTKDRSSAPAYIAEVFGAPPGTEMVIRARLLGDPESREPLQLSRTYIPIETTVRLPVLEAADTGPGGMLDRIEEAGDDLHWTVEIGSRMPDAVEAADLLTPGGIPLIQMLRATRQGPEVMEVTEYVFSSERFRVAFALERAESAREHRSGT